MVDDHTYGSFMDMTFVRSVEEGPYEKRIARLIPKRRAEFLTSTVAYLDLWCYGGHVRKKWFASNHDYWASDIDF